MKQEHEMTPGVLVSGEVLSAGDARARVAVLEAEVAELRKRVCVPDGWRVFAPTSTTLRHGERWEVYGPNGGGVVNADDVKDWAVRGLLDAIADAPAPVERCDTCGGHGEVSTGETQRFGDLHPPEPVMIACPECDGQAPVERNWPEDADHENGQYYNRCVHCGNQFVGHKRRPACKACSAAPVERVEQEAVSYYERAHGEKSPTHGMTLGERIAHVGGRTNAAGYMEFGSVMAVSALIDHVLRDSPAPQPAPTAAPSRDVIRATLMDHGFTIKTGHDDLKPYVYEAVEALFARPAPAAQDSWVSVAERMPPAGTKVLAFYRNSMGVSRRICAEYIGKHQRDAFDFDSDYGDTDYDEASDQYYWPEGWYERVDNWDELTHLAVTEGEITHWRVMPAVPGLDAHQRGGAK